MFLKILQNHWKMLVKDFIFSELNFEFTKNELFLKFF